LLKALATVLSIVIFVALSEVVLNIFDPELGYKNQFFPLNRDIDFPEFYKKDTKLFWRLRENQTLESRWFSRLSYQINSVGLRGQDIEVEKKGRRILAIGNSCTFGWGVPIEQCWTTKLQSSLRQQLSDSTIEVVNAGIPGYSSFQGKQFFGELLQYNPEVVLIMFGWNDHWRAGKEISDAEQEMPPAMVVQLQNVFSGLKLYKLLRKMTLTMTEDTQLVRMDEISGKRRVSQDEFFQNLTEIIKVARKNNIRPVLLVPPIASLENYYEGTRSNLHLLHRRYQDKVFRTSEYQQADIINLQEIFDQFDMLFDDARGDPIHFNAQGHEVAALAISEKLLPILNSKE
jgi:lysophospholipase L1-like esterase